MTFEKTLDALEFGYDKKTKRFIRVTEVITIVEKVTYKFEGHDRRDWLIWKENKVVFRGTATAVKARLLMNIY